VENWAAMGFWKDLIQGLRIFKEGRTDKIKDLPLAFFTWHDKVEAQHALHTQEELEEYYFRTEDLNVDLFIKYGNEMLDGVHEFWTGLEVDRIRMEGQSITFGSVNMKSDENVESFENQETIPEYKQLTSEL